MRICIVQLGRIGDLILMTPLIAAIKSKYPDAKIDFLVGPSNYRVLIDNDNIHKLIIYKKTPISIILTILKLLFTKYDYWIDPKDHFSNESKILANIARAKTKVGFNSDKKVFDISLISNSNQLHFVERAIKTLQFLGINSNIENKPKLYLNNNSETLLKQFLIKNEISEYILLNISATSEIRKFDKSFIKKMIDFIGELNLKLVISSDKNDFKLANEFIEKGKVYHFESQSINDIFSLVNKSSLLITPDTSLVHIASAFNKALIAFYTNNLENLEKFKPLSEKCEILISETESIKTINLDDFKTAFFKIKNQLNHQ